MSTVGKMFFSKTVVFVIIFAVVLYNVFSPTRWENHPDRGLTVDQLLEKYGYPCEEHTVVTEDGYVLTLYRIPHGKNEKKEKSRNVHKPAILIMHCIMGSSAEYVLMGDGKALGPLLADNGYDVWIGNARGTPASKRHIKFDAAKNRDEFWNFSWHEIGKYDVPAMIDYILEETKQNKTYYIGTSQGTAEFVVMMSERPEYNNKIKLMISVSPGVFMGHTTSAIVRFLGDLSIIRQEMVFWLFGLHEEFLSPDGYLAFFIRYGCHKDSPFLRICKLVLADIVGPDNEKVDKNDFSLIFPSFPTSCSGKQVRHYLQVVKYDDFLKFDHGEVKNLELYGQEKPPPYDLSKTTAPVAVIYAENDTLMTTEATKRLIKLLPNVVYDHMLRNMNHFEVVYAGDIHQPLLKILNKFK